MQEKGIHAHVEKDGQRVIDDTFGEVLLEGDHLDRNDLIARMINATVWQSVGLCRSSLLVL